MARPVSAMRFSWLVVVVVQTVYTSVGVNASTCPDWCTCTGNSTIICQNVNVHRWPDVCKSFNSFVLLENTFLDLYINGEVSDSAIQDFDCIPPVKSLHISFMNLKTVPKSLNNLKVVETLSLSRNEIRILPDNIFSSLESIRTLNLSHNNISMLGPETFLGLYQLESLDLSYNDIKSVHPLSLQALTNLTYLNFGHNKIEHFTSWHLPSLSRLQVLIMNENKLKTFYIGENASDAMAINQLQSLDISSNPLECTCILQKLLNKVSAQGGVIDNAELTLCQSPSTVTNISVVLLNETALKCSYPHSLITFPSKKKSVLYRSTITLECQAEAYPSPHIMWVTPWGEKFSTAPLSLIEHIGLASGDKISYFREYEEINVMMTTSIKVTETNNLVISHFRGSMTGDFSCVAFNEVGSKMENIRLSVHSMLKSTYLTSLKFASYCASGCLIVGFIVGFIHIGVRKLRHRFSFKVPLFTPAVSVRPTTEGPSSIYSDLSPPTSPLLASSSEKSLATIMEYMEEDESSERRPHYIFDSIGGAKGKLRDGVGRKMESMRRNVQSIKESTGAYVHTIMESGSSAANKMKAGVVMGMETVKSHVQSVKELCGTGNMGTHTISIISMETDIDTNQRKSVVRQVTFV